MCPNNSPGFYWIFGIVLKIKKSVAYTLLLTENVITCFYLRIFFKRIKDLSQEIFRSLPYPLASSFAIQMVKSWIHILVISRTFGICFYGRTIYKRINDLSPAFSRSLPHSLAFSFAIKMVKSLTHILLIARNFGIYFYGRTLLQKDTRCVARFLQDSIFGIVFWDVHGKIGSSQSCGICFFMEEVFSKG